MDWEPYTLAYTKEALFAALLTDNLHVREGTHVVTSAAAREELQADNHTSSHFWHEDGS